MIALPSAVSAPISRCCSAVGGDRSALALPKPLVASNDRSGMISTHFHFSPRKVSAIWSNFSDASRLTSGVGEPARIVVVEQVAQHRAARRLVGFDADELRQIAV